nr:hypothetical protein [Pelargonium line pattern virus]
MPAGRPLPCELTSTSYEESHCGGVSLLVRQHPEGETTSVVPNPTLNVSLEKSKNRVLLLSVCELYLLTSSVDKIPNFRVGFGGHP